MGICGVERYSVDKILVHKIKSGLEPLDMRVILLELGHEME